MPAARGAGARSESGSGPALVGLTGGIGAGKSAALAALERLGAATLSSDAVVHELLTTDELRDVIVERLGDGVAPDGSIDRAALADAVFERPEEREWLERTLWPHVADRIAAWREREASRRPPRRAAVIEVPLLFESGMDAACDATVAVVAEEGTRRSRAAGRRHRALESRTKRQLSQDEKARRADYVVRNDGDLDDLEQSLRTVLAKLEA